MNSIALVVILLVLYFIPTFAAKARQHHNAGAIFVLNLFAGWTFIGWVGALVWAMTATKTANAA
jgi:hypothetical protein